MNDEINDEINDEMNVEMKIIEYLNNKNYSDIEFILYKIILNENFSYF